MLNHAKNNRQEMSLTFKSKDCQLFEKYIDQCTNYFEFGSGGSTYYASTRDNVKSVTSIESDIQWAELLIHNVNDDKLNMIHIDMDTKPRSFGYPGPNATFEQRKSYSDQIINTDVKPDMVLIDGRFRVACCLKCFDAVDDDCIIIFDDFLNRKEYHTVLDYYDIIDKSDENIMVVLKKKNVSPPKPEIIKEYELYIAG